jgi:hypothetical protein
MAFASRLTGEEAYAQAAWKSLIETTSKDAPANILEAGGLAADLAVAISWIRDWPGIQREEMIHAEKLIADMVGRMFAYFNPPSFGRLELHRGENWDAQILSALGIGACFLEGHPKREIWLDLAQNSAIAWLNRRKGDGGLCEGTMNYHLYALWNMSRLADALRENGRTNLFEHDGLRKMFEFVAYTLAPDGRVPGFNDSERTNLHKRNSSDTLLLKGALEYSLPMFMWAYRRVHEDLPQYYESFPFTILFYPDKENAEPPPAPTSRAFPYVGWVSMRNGWDRASTHLVLKAGPCGGWHDHFDKSTFELVGKGVPLAVDAGCGSYSDRMDWFRRSESHNVVLIDRQNQCAGGARIIHWWSSAAADYALVDCRRSLVGLDGGTGRGHLRHVLYDKRNDCFVFLDNISGAKDCEWLLHSRGVLAVEKQQAVWTTAEGVRLSARFLGPEVAIARKVGKAAGVEAYGPATDVEYISARPVGQETEFVALIEPLLRDQERVHVEPADEDAGYYLLDSRHGISHLKVMRENRRDCRGELEFNGLAALVNTAKGRLEEFSLVGATLARLAGRLLCECAAPTDICLEGFDGDQLTGTLRVWGELAEVPILTCDGFAASIFQEKSSAGPVEISLGLPWPPKQILLSGKPVRFSRASGEAAVHFSIETTGEEHSLVIMSEDSR